MFRRIYFLIWPMTRCSKSAHLAAQNCVVAVRSSPAKESRCFWMQEMKHETKADLGGEHQLWQLWWLFWTWTVGNGSNSCHQDAPGGFPHFCWVRSLEVSLGACIDSWDQDCTGRGRSHATSFSHCVRDLRRSFSDGWRSCRSPLAHWHFNRNKTEHTFQDVKKMMFHPSFWANQVILGLRFQLSIYLGGFTHTGTLGCVSYERGMGY